MANLTAAPALGGYERDFDGTMLREVTDFQLISIATPLGGDDALAAAVKKTYKLDMPSATMTVEGKGTRLIATQPDQMFMLGNVGIADVAKALGDVAYLTDQSDGWVMLELSGPQSRAALERICQVDLHPDVFTVGTAARTSMEHLGTLLVRTDVDTYALLSASSSAGSFLHAVETSLHNL